MSCIEAVKEKIGFRREASRPAYAVSAFFVGARVSLWRSRCHGGKKIINTSRGCNKICSEKLAETIVLLVNQK